MFTKAFLLDAAERVIWTFLQAFGAVVIINGWSWESLQIALAAGGISVLKCLIAMKVGNSNTAQALPGVESAYVASNP